MAKVLAILSVTPDYQEFGVPELKSILRRTGIPLSTLLKHEISQFPQHQYAINYKSFQNYPFIVLNIPDFQKHREYLQRAAWNGVMVTKFILLISEGNTYQQLFQTFDKGIIGRQLSVWERRLLCQFYSRNRVIGRTEQKAKIHGILERMEIKGKVDLDTPEVIIALVEDHKWFNKHHEVPSEQTLNKVFFGVELSSNRSLKGGAKFNLKYQLSNRIYLGPTTTDNDLAFLMCHQGLVDQNSFVLDPFAGTGSLLVPPSHYGCYVFGSDLDIRVLNGYSVGQINKRSKYYQKQRQYEIFTPKIMLNFEQYELKKPEVFRMDCLKGRFRSKGMFDAIICDPPYGIRAMSRKINHSNKQHPSEEQEPNTKIQTVQQHQPQLPQKQLQKQEPKQLQPIQKQQNAPNTNQEQTQQQQLAKRSEKRKVRKEKKKERRDQLSEPQKQYKQEIQNKFCNELKNKWADKPTIQCVTKDQIYNGLLGFADTYLKEDGYLVFLYPVLAEEKYQGTAEELPKHPRFQLIDYSEHKLKQGNARILITMRKIPQQPIQ